MPAEDIKILEKYGQVLTRDNIGYDTAAFREGILSLGKDKLQQYSQLMLVNDTNIGPMRDLTAVFQSMIEKILISGAFLMEKHKKILQDLISTVISLNIYNHIFLSLSLCYFGQKLSIIIGNN